MKVLTTIHPYAPFIAEVAAHPIISGVRLNTVMAVLEPSAKLLKSIKDQLSGKNLWIDLKCRQIRTVHGAFYKAPDGPKKYEIDGKTYILDPSSPKSHGELKSPPWAELKISRKIKLDLSKGPVKCWMQDGYDSAHIVEVRDGDTLIMLDGPQRVVGGGESINILDPTLEIEGYFTDLDLRYIEASKAAGNHTYMLSYVEQDSDIDQLLELDPEAEILAKIESLKGLRWVKESYAKYAGRKVRLMAARGDLYVEIERPDKILRALKRIVKSDPTAVAASRILTSLMKNARPACSDITDVACLVQMGYGELMIGDDICFNRDALMLALDILSAIDKER